MTCRRIVLALSALAHAWTWGVGLFHVFNPNAYSTTSASLIEVNGLSAVLALLVPIVVSGVFLAVAVSKPGGRAVTVSLLWLTAIVMLGFCVLGAASIGIGYAPGALLMLAAALVDCSSLSS